MEDFLEDVLGSSPPKYKLLEQAISLILDDAVQFERFGIHLETAFELFELILHKAKEQLDAYGNQKVRFIVADTLALLRLYQPNNVEDFIATHNFSQKEILQIRNKAMETVGDIIARDGGYFPGWVIVENPFPRQRSEFIWMLKRATECKSANLWFREFTKWLINSVYDKIIFDIGVPPKEDFSPI
jgi:hypothetical protein